MIDVVIPTLVRDSLPHCLNAVHSVFGDTQVFIQSERDVPLGEIRNIGLRKCQTELVAFIDDDIIVDTVWLQKCLAALKSDSNLIMVQGVVPEGETLGCMIVRRKPFLQRGGFPMLDSFVNQRFADSYMVLADAVCFHYARGFTLVSHAVKWIFSFYQTEFRCGLYNNPKDSIACLVRHLRKGKPEMVLHELLFLVKTFFALPFILEDKLGKERLK